MTDVEADLYDKRTVQFKNLTGRVYITAESSHYLGDFLDAAKSNNNGQESSYWGFGGSSAMERASDLMRGQY